MVNVAFFSLNSKFTVYAYKYTYQYCVMATRVKLMSLSSSFNTSSRRSNSINNSFQNSSGHATMLELGTKDEVVRLLYKQMEKIRVKIRIQNYAIDHLFDLQLEYYLSVRELQDMVKRDNDARAHDLKCLMFAILAFILIVLFLF